MKSMKSNILKKKFIGIFLSLTLVCAGLFACPVFSLNASAAVEYLDDNFAEYVNGMRDALQDHDVLGAIYLCDGYAIRADASDDATTVITVASGQSVIIKDLHVVQENGTNVPWYQVLAYVDEKEYVGYARRDFIATADEMFLEAEESLKTGINKKKFKLRLFAAAPLSDDTNYSDVDKFPASYRPALMALKQNHPNWTFVVQDTKLDWQTSINKELLNGKSLVPNTYYDYHKEGEYGQGWYYASENILKWYMDPRGWLDDKHIFQFEQLSYNSSYHTEEALDLFLKGTFMSSTDAQGTGVCAKGTNKTYAKIFLEVGAKYNVSPFHLASRVIQEQGTKGESRIIAGDYPGYEGYYNYFNVNATGQSDGEVYANGLSYAKGKGWTNALLSIDGGAATISLNYIKNGQDTGYLQKFNMSSYDTYGHQYMQNIAAPSNEAVSTYELYAKTDSVNRPFVFKIPVYNNMPESVCVKPTSTTNVVLEIPAGYDKTVYVDGVAMTGVERNGQYIINTGKNTARNAVVYKYTNGIPTGMYVWTIYYANNNYYENPRPELKDMLGCHGFSIRLTGSKGIRFKSSISTSARSQLTGSGVDGYKLVEYGTLIMGKNNMGTYPFVYGGEKIRTATAFGSGVDNIYATVDGRYQFTGVLVDMPAEAYKSELAFRSYAVLKKGSDTSIVYGPIFSRSIYSLANSYISNGTYKNGTSEYSALQEIIANAK